MGCLLCGFRGNWLHCNCYLQELTDQATNVTYIQTALDKARKWSTGGAPTASHRHLCCHGNQKDTPSESICCSSLETNARTPSPDMQNSCDIKCSSHRKQNSSSNTNVESPKRTDGLVICSCSCTHDQLCSVKNCAVAPSTTVNELMLMFHKDCDDGCNICTNTTSGEKEQGLKRTGSDCDTSACKIIRLNHDKDPDILHLDHDNKSSCKLGQNIEHTDPHDQESTGCLPLAIEPPSDGKLCESSLSTVVPKVTSHDSKSTSSDEVSIDSIVNAFCDSRVIKLVCDIMKENVWINIKMVHCILPLVKLLLHIYQFATSIFQHALRLHFSMHYIYILTNVSSTFFSSGCKAGLILGLHPANERCHNFVTASLIGWVQA